MCTLLPRPFTLAQRKQSSAQPENMLCHGRFWKGQPILALVWVLPYCRILGVASLASFHPSPTRHCLPKSWNVREIPRIVVCQVGPISANHGAPRIPTRWACASQPGRPPLRAQFRSGIAYEWSSFLFLGLGELLWCSMSGLLSIKTSFGLESLMNGFRFCFSA